VRISDVLTPMIVWVAQAMVDAVIVWGRTASDRTVLSGASGADTVRRSKARLGNLAHMSLGA
jgi:hypothetical protein